MRIIEKLHDLSLMLCVEASILMLVCTCRQVQACMADKALCCRPVARSRHYNHRVEGGKKSTRRKIPVWGSVEQMKREGDDARVSFRLHNSPFFFSRPLALPTHPLFSLYCIRLEKCVSKTVHISW